MVAEFEEEDTLGVLGGGGSGVVRRPRGTRRAMATSTSADLVGIKMTAAMHRWRPVNRGSVRDVIERGEVEAGAEVSKKALCDRQLADPSLRESKGVAEVASRQAGLATGVPPRHS